MDKFYGGGGTERCGGRALPVTRQHCKASAITERRDEKLRMADPMPASTPYDSEPADYGRQLAAGFALKYGVALDAD